MIKRVLAGLLAVILMFGCVACAGDGSSVPEITSVAPPVSVPSSSSSQPEEPVVLNQAFLTGLEKAADYPEGKRITAVMINNISGSRPQRGIADAKILIEILVEGGITRFMGLYEDYETMPVVGPVRSARDQFFQLLLPYWGFYVHNAQSGITKTLFDVYEYGGFNLDVNFYPSEGNDPADLNAIAWRDAERRAAGFPKEYTQYTAGANIASIVEQHELDSYRSYGSPIFDFVPYTEPARVPRDGRAEELLIIHSPSYRTLFEYNRAGARYDMSMWHNKKGEVEPAIDENNGQQVGFDNVVVLFAPMRPYPSGTDGLIEVTYDVGGAGYYFSQGGYELIFWNKGPANQPLLLYRGDKSGEMVKINPGTTYLSVVNDAYLPDFHEVLTTGTAGEVAGEGEANPDEVDSGD